VDKLEETGSSQSAGNDTSTVETVRGPIDSCELGATLMHEHIFIVTAEIQRSYPLAWWDEDVEVERAVTQLRRVKEVGVDTIVDLTVPGLGRYLPLVERVGRQVDVNIIAATGYYSFGWLPAYFQQRGPGTMLGGPDGLAEMFLRDIREGIDGTRPSRGVRGASRDGNPYYRPHEQLVRDGSLGGRLLPESRR
jgi:phosphotriesterase-related protein